MATGIGDGGGIWIAPLAAALAFIVLGTAYWVYRDADRRGSDRAAAWGVGMLLLGPAVPLGFAVYLAVRRDPDDAAPSPTRAHRLVGNLVVATLLTYVVAAVLAPPDPFTQLYYAAVALPILVAMAVLVTYWDVVRAAR